MGTVLSFNPRDRHPIYSSQPNFPYNQNAENQAEKLNDTAGSIDSHLNNFSYEQLNNAKNRENKKSAISHQISRNPNTCGSMQFNMHTQINSHNFNNLTVTSKDTINNDLDSHNENSIVISEKTSIEKSLKKHSLFINALSWKKLSTSHNKKKVENKNKCANIPSACFKAQLLEASYPPRRLIRIRIYSSIAITSRSINISNININSINISNINNNIIAIKIRSLGNCHSFHRPRHRSHRPLRNWDALTIPIP